MRKLFTLAGVAFVVLAILAVTVSCGRAATPTPTLDPRVTPTPTRPPTPTPTPTPTPQPVAGCSALTGRPRFATPRPATIVKTPTPTLTKTPVGATPVQIRMTPTPGLAFRGTEMLCNWPSQVQFVFSLRDETGKAITLPAKDVQAAARVYEQGLTTQGWEEIDYAETSFAVHTTENLELEAAFVLDFTNSVAQDHLPDGRNGVQASLDAFRSAVNGFPSAHRIGAVEFHDRNSDPTVLAPLSTDRNALVTAVSRFAASPFDSGSSRVWDAMSKTLSMFTSAEAKPNVIRAMIVISDGRDTSSSHSMQEVFSLAQRSGIQVYFLGLRDAIDQPDLSRLVVETGGSFYQVSDVSKLKGQLEASVQDIRAQYKFSYVTLRREGAYNVRVLVMLGTRTGSFESQPLDVAYFYAPDNLGGISFDPPTVDWTKGQASFYARAMHLPRNINRLRFKLDTAAKVQVMLVTEKEGGLLEGWRVTGPDGDGYFDVSSTRTLDFGNYGLLFRIDMSGITEKETVLPIEFDNSIYTTGKSFEYPAAVRLGAPTTGQ